jgi:hypothetical protein
MARAALLSVLALLLFAAPASATLAPPHGDAIPPGADAVLADAAGPVMTSLASGSWCGDETPADDVVHQATLGNAIKVVYAYTPGANHFDAYTDVIQSDIKAVADAMLDASNGEKTVRFDVGTSCGPTYVDIQSVPLPRSRATYRAMDASTRFGAVADDLDSLVAGSPSCPVVSWDQCSRDFLVYADGLYAGDGVTGTATRRPDATASPANDSNDGAQFAIVWGNATPQFGISSATTAEHEMLHNLGAVQNVAPHSTRAGHCFDQVDVMCYPDGGPLGLQASMITNCPGAPDSTIDCGHDDYFNPDGPVLSASSSPMWNIYDSAFLCPADGCGSGGTTISSAPTGGGATTATVTPAPRPAAPPVRPATPTTTPATPVKPPAAESLTGTVKVSRSQLRSLLAGRALRITYRPNQSGAFTVRLMLGHRAVATASVRAKAGRRVTATLHLSAELRRRLRSQQSRLKLTFALRR